MGLNWPQVIQFLGALGVAVLVMAPGTHERRGCLHYNTSAGRQRTSQGEAGRGWEGRE